MHAYQVLSPCVQALGRLRSEEVILKRGNLLLFTNMYCCLLMLVISMTMHIRLSKFHGFIYFSFWVTSVSEQWEDAITKYGNTICKDGTGYLHYAHTFEICTFHFQFLSDPTIETDPTFDISIWVKKACTYDTVRHLFKKVSFQNSCCCCCSVSTSVSQKPGEMWKWNFARRWQVVQEHFNFFVQAPGHTLWCRPIKCAN